MADVGVYTEKETLDHKIRDGRKEDDVYCFWAFSRFGRMDVKEGERFWIASQGRWQGYFEIFQTSDNDEIPPSEYDPYDDGEVRFWSESWHPLDNLGSRTPFQGYTYNVPKLQTKGEK